MLSLLHLVVKAQQYLETLSCMFLDKKILFEIWINPELNLTIFQGTEQLCSCFTQFDGSSQVLNQFDKFRDKIA